MRRIVFLDRGSLPISLRRPKFECEWVDHPDTPPDQVLPRLRGATVAVTNKTPITRQHLEGLPDLKMVAVSATGTDCVDSEACRRAGILVTNIPGYAIDSLVEHTLMLILALRRRLIEYYSAVQQGDWQRQANFALNAFPYRDLHGTTLGVIGHGAIGRRVGELAQAMGMRVLIAERRDAETTRAGRSAFREVLADSDVISLHCPLTPETRSLIAARELSQMMSGALLVNTARGGLVQPQSIADALISGRLGGYGSDVLEVEPPGSNHPLIRLNLPNLILTPHIAWASEGSMQKLGEMLIDNLDAFLERNNP